jgi:hypothetical protein
MEELTVQFRRVGPPTELWGTFRGFQWEFYAKYGNWEFHLTEQPGILPELMKPNDAGFLKSGTFKEMSLDDAEQIVRDCLCEYTARKEG